MNIEQVLIITASIILSLFIFFLAKYISKKFIIRQVMNHDAEAQALKDHRTGFFYAQWIIIGGWSIFIAVYLLFFSYNFHEELPSLNEEATAIEAQQNVAATKEEIKTSNIKIIVDEEAARQKKIDEEKQRAREEYERKLKQSTGG